MVRSNQKGASTLNPARQRRADTGVWPCTLDGCTKVFAREADLKRHQRTTKSHLVPGSGVGSPCPLCDSTFTRTDAMRRHLKSRHNGKTPETLHLPETQAGPSTTSGKRRKPSPPSDTSEFSGSEGEVFEPDPSASSSRAQSTAPPFYDDAHAPPPPPNTLSPAVLYQAALSYEIRHALAPSSPSSSPTSPVPSHTPTTSALRTDGENGSSPRLTYNPPPAHEPFAQYPGQYNFQHLDLSHSHPHSPHSPYSPGDGPSGPVYPNGVYAPDRNSDGPPPSPYGPHPPAWSSGPGAGGSPVKIETVDVSVNRRPGGGQRADHSPPSPFAQHEPVPSGLAALAMHAARIRPMSPLPEGKQSSQAVITKSELESALGPSYAR